VHFAAAQLIPLLSTCASAVQSLLQLPHVWGAAGDVQALGAHISKSPAQTHAPHWQLGPHVCVPPVPQVCVASGWHTPSPSHADQTDQVPSEHVRVLVPQRPHDWLIGPAHDVPTADIPPEGSDTGVVTGDQAPHSGTASVLAVHAVVTTSVAPCAAALAQAPAGNLICEPLTVQSVPSSNTTQHAVGPHTPADPEGNCSATLSVAALAPDGSEAVQVAMSTGAAMADAKHPCTSKQPFATDASAPAVPASPALGEYVGSDDAGTVVATHAPCAQVWPSGHVEPTPPSASVWAVPTQR
jgi:hypothetical protein